MTNKFITFFNQIFGITDDQLPDDLIDDRVKVAAAVVMVEMARDRSKVDSSYQSVFTAELASFFKLSESAAVMLEKHADMIDAEETSLFPFTHLLNEQFDYKQKLQLIKALWDAASQLHGVDRDEDVYIHKVAKLLHISYRDLMKQKPE